MQGTHARILAMTVSKKKFIMTTNNFIAPVILEAGSQPHELTPVEEDVVKHGITTHTHTRARAHVVCSCYECMNQENAGSVKASARTILSPEKQ